MIAPRVIQETYGHEMYLAPQSPMYDPNYLPVTPETTAEKSVVFNLSGPSGSGKLTVTNALADALRQKGISFSRAKSVTTRVMRNPSDFDQYHLLRYSPDGVDLGFEEACRQFHELDEQGLLIAPDKVPHKDGFNLYAVLLSPDGINNSDVTLIETTVAALPAVKEAVSNVSTSVERRVDFFSSYLLPPGTTVPDMIEELVARQLGREGETDSTIRGRLLSKSSVTPGELASVLMGCYPIDYLMVNHAQEQGSPSSLVLEALAQVVKAKLPHKKQAWHL